MRCKFIRKYFTGKGINRAGEGRGRGINRAGESVVSAVYGNKMDF